VRDDVAAAWEGVGEVLAGTVDRLVDALAATGRIGADVERDWLDERGREWAERAALVRRALMRELDATLAAARSVGDALRLGDTGEDPRSIGSAGLGRATVSRSGGPRLGDTDADRVEEERGMRIARLGDEPS
jgi:hypothetical protein